MLTLDTKKPILSFFAHPDDETLGAGGLIHKLGRHGFEVHVAIPSTGIHSRRSTMNERERELALTELKKNCVKAVSYLGVPEKRIYLGDFPDNEMDMRSQLDINHWVEKIMGDIKPQAVLTHHRFCTNVDHRYCHEAAVVATRPGLNSNITLLTAEIPGSTGHLRPSQWEPNYFVELAKEDLEAKIQSLETYSTEIRKDPHPRSREVITALAKVRGSESGFYFAESFMIQRAFG